MHEIHIHTHTGVDGIAHLNIPVGIPNRDIEMTVSYALELPKNKVESSEGLFGVFDSRESNTYIPVENLSFTDTVVSKAVHQGISFP